MDDRTLDFDVFKDCRICLQSYPQMHELFAEANNFCNLLRDCGRIEIEANDGLPVVICEFCIKELMHVHQFVHKCQISDKKLRSCLKLQYEKKKAEKIDESKENGLNIAVGTIKIELEYSPSHQPDFLFHNTFKEEDSIDPDFSDSFSSKNNCLKKYKIKKNIQKISSDSTKVLLLKKHSNEKKGLSHKKKVRKHDPEFPRQCVECPLILKTRSTMLLHMVTHTGDNPYQCDHCGKCVRSKGSLKSHIIRFHLEDGVRRHLCTECNKRFYRKTDLIVHLRTHSKETPYACTYCPRKFIQSCQVLRHIRRSHTGIKPFQCAQCSKAFYTSSELDQHKIKHSNERPHPCPECGQLYKTKVSLKHHLLLHNNPKSYVCDQCAATFSNRANLSTHSKRVHSKKSGICHFCTKEFSNLEDHLRMHTGETPFQCHVCNKKYSLKQSLRIHMRTHSDPSKFTCEYEGCLKTFKLKWMLDFHVNKYHKKEPSYLCRYCSRGFFRVTDLRRHTDMGHSDKEFVSTEDLRKSKVY